MKKKLTTLCSSVIPTISSSTSCYEVFIRSANFYINRFDLNIHHVVPQRHKIARGELNELDHVV